MSTLQYSGYDPPIIKQRTPDCDKCRVLYEATIAAHEKAWWLTSAAWCLLAFLVGFWFGRAAAFWL